MDELEEKINSVLSDSQQMEKITRLAQSIMAGTSPKSEPNADDAGIDMNMLARISRLFSADTGKDGGERAVLEAMAPYLSDRRRGKLEKALKIAKLTRLARMAMEESEGNA